MKAFVIASCLLSAFSALAEGTCWRSVESRPVAWRPNETYHVELQIPCSWNNPGDFTRAVIRTATGKEFVFEDQDGMVAWEDRLDKQDFKERSLVQSQYLYLSPDILTGKGSPALLLFGYPYASSPGRLHVITLDNGGEPHEVFASLLSVDSIVPANKDRGPRLVGHQCYAQMDNYRTYAPFSVFVLDESGSGAARLSENESAAYNLAHYAGWRGAECSTAYRIVPTKDGTGERIVTEEEAARIYEAQSNSALEPTGEKPPAAQR